MDKLNIEQIRLVIVSVISPIAALFTPTKSFLIALVISFAFNIWAGMRSDGVTIVHCKNFKFDKFKNALAELLVYVAIIQMLYTIMALVGDASAGLLTIKSINYVFMYIYVSNGFKNLIKAYPKNKAYRIIYHLLRFEFNRVAPTKVQEIIDRVNHAEDNNTKKGS